MTPLLQTLREPCLGASYKVILIAFDSEVWKQAFLHTADNCFRETGPNVQKCSSTVSGATNAYRKAEAELSSLSEHLTHSTTKIELMTMLPLAIIPSAMQRWTEIGTHLRSAALPGLLLCKPPACVLLACSMSILNHPQIDG